VCFTFTNTCALKVNYNLCNVNDQRRLMIIADQVKKEEEKQMFELKTQENEVQGIYLHTNLKFFYLNKVHLILFYFTPK